MVGHCAADTVLLKSVGHDPIYLDSSSWNDSPFTLRLVPPDTTLDSGVSRKLVVTFCPQDTGDARFTAILDARGDSLPTAGHGILRLAVSTPAVNLGRLCFGHPSVATEIISNLGNDTISIFSLGGKYIGFDSVGLLLQPQDSITIPISIPADTLGSFADTIAVFLAGDTLHTILNYRVAGPSLKIDPNVQFNFVCIGEPKMDTVPISSAGGDTLTISYDSLLPGSPFALLHAVTQLPPNGNDSLLLQFYPLAQNPTEETDTLHLIATSGGCDSTFTLILRGTGGDTGLAANSLVFGTVTLGACLDSSIVIGNPCGPAAIIDSVQHSNSDFRSLSLLPDTVPADGNLRFAVKFCPTDTGAESDTVTLLFHSGKIISTVLFGRGFQPAIPRAYFTLSRTTDPMGDSAFTTITFDSSSLAGRHPISASLTFDPTVLAPLLSFPSLDTLHGADSLTFSGPLDFSRDTTFLEQITWLTLAGPHDNSAINLSVKSDTPLNVRVNPGSVTLTDCFGLAGHLASGGSYLLGAITPDPASEAVSLTMQIGSDGYVEAAIYDVRVGSYRMYFKKTLNRGVINSSSQSFLLLRAGICLKSVPWDGGGPHHL